MILVEGWLPGAECMRSADIDREGYECIKPTTASPVRYAAWRRKQIASLAATVWLRRVFSETLLTDERAIRLTLAPSRAPPRPNSIDDGAPTPARC